MIMPSEGIQYPTYEDEYGVMITTDADENPVPAEDEAYYCEWIVSGLAEEEDAYAAERDFPGDYFTESELDHFAQIEADRYEAHMTAHW